MTTKTSDLGAEAWSPERGVHAASACELKEALAKTTASDRPIATGPEGMNVVSPNGAMPYQPRAERSAALGWTTQWNIALKGRSMGGVMRCDGSPLQGFGPMAIPTQGDALGWNSIAPLGLDTGAGRAPAERGVHAASACELKETLAKTTPSTSRPSKRPEGRAPVRHWHASL